MSTHLLAVVVGIPLAWHLGLAAYVAYDASRHGMAPRKWTLIALFVPLFGFFAYLFERDEQEYDPATDPYAKGGYNVHESQGGEEEAGDDSGATGRSSEGGDRGR